MTKRIIDSDLWRSDKLSKIQPSWIKAEYANLIPLAQANGSFEANDRRIWANVYSFNRPEITIELVQEILKELERVKLLFRWTDGTGKPWAYFVGIDKPGRLPGKSRRGRNESVGLEPPRDELFRFLESAGSANGNENFPGSGSGIGSGLGKNLFDDALDKQVRVISRQSQMSQTMLQELSAGIYAEYPRKVGKAEAIRAIAKAIRKIATAGVTESHPAF